MGYREKLIELIGQVQYLGGLELALADNLLANGVTFQKWIPVTERLPEYDTDVLTFRGTAGFCIECYHTDGWGFDNIFMDDITHWMPLPEQPKEETDG